MILKKKTKNNKGFSLIELVIVVGIISILALVAIPQIVGYRRDSANSLAKQALMEIHMIQARYYQDYGKFCCPSSCDKDITTASPLLAYQKGIAEYLEKKVHIKVCCFKLTNNCQDGYTIKTYNERSGTKMYTLVGPLGKPQESDIPK